LTRLYVNGRPIYSTRLGLFTSHGQASRTVSPHRFTELTDTAADGLVIRTCDTIGTIIYP